ncbi:MAG: choice-of-anchor D domain-containing protein, partial [Terracidiphilus sp.]
GVNPTTLSATTLPFGDVVINETSVIRSFTLRNNQLTALGITSITPPAGGYAVDPSTTCGTSLAAGATCTISLTLTPTALGAIAAGKLTIATTSPSQSLTVALTGTGVPPTTLSATTLPFGDVVINETSVIRSFTLKNNQLTALGIASITPPAGGYAVVPATTCGSSLADGATCTISLTLTPTALGTIAAGKLTIATTSPSLSLTVALTGTGVPPTTVSATSVNFGYVVVQETSTTHNITVRNNQLVPLNFTSMPAVTGSEFAIVTPTSPAIPCTSSTPLAPSATCTIPLTLTSSAAPGGLGSQTSALTIVTDGGGTQTVALTGWGILPVTVSKAALNFATTLVGNTSAALTLIVKNQQDKVLHITPFPISGTNPGDFAWTSTGATACGSSIAASSSCTVSVTFTPLASGPRLATLDITDDSSTSPHLVTLSGDGNATVNVTPMSITSFSTPVGNTSHSITVTIKNNNTSPSDTVTINSFQTTGDFLTTPISCSPLPFTLAAGATCTAAVQFAPTIGGTSTGQLQVNDSALTSPQVVNLSGNGIDPLTVATNPVAIKPPNLIYSAQPAGTISGPKSVTLTNLESQPEKFSLQLTGDFIPAGNSCSSGAINSGSINAKSSCVIAVDFAPAATAANGPDNGTLTISDSAPGGTPLSVSLTGSVGIPEAAVAEITPGAGAAGTSVPVVILGNGYTNFSPSSVITFVDTDSSTYPADITVSNQTFVSANQIDATLVLGTPSANSGYGARNITIKTSLTGGGTQTAFLNSAFTIYDPTNTHTITVVNPNIGTQGQTLNVALSATGTHWVQGVTFFNFGTGIAVNSDLISPDGTDAVVNIIISNTTTVGTRTIVAMTGGEYASSAAGAFQVNPNSATLVSVTPNTEAQGWSGQLQLTATGTHFQPGATTVSIGGGVIVGAVNVLTLTTATVEVAVPANATVGPQNVTVATGGEIATLENGFTVTGATPALISIVPDSGQQGQTGLPVVITGNQYTNFAACSPLSIDMTGEINATITGSTANTVTLNVSISPYANVGGITGNLICGPAGAATLFPFGFGITPVNASMSVSPTSVPQGGQVTLTLVGVNTLWTQAQTTAAFYPELVPTPIVNEIQVQDNTNATLNITVPVGVPVGNYPFYLATGGQVVSASIHVYANTPSVAMSPANGLVPSSGVSNYSVSLSGQFTKWSTGCGASTSTTVVIAGEGVTLPNFCVTSPESATATLSIAAGAATTSRLVTVTTGSQVLTTYFNVTRTPVGIISITPSHTAQGVTTQVEIVGLNTHFAGSNTTSPTCSTGVATTTVQFGPEIAVSNVCVIDSAHLTASITTNFSFNGSTLPTTPGYQTVYVNTGNEQVTGSEQVLGSFSVDAPASPTLVSVVPSSAPQGSTEDVTITGSLTNWVQNQTEAILGAGVTIANLTITSLTTATATISVSPTAPVGGNSVTMITGSEIVGGTGFSVTPSAAYISSVEPNFTCPAQPVANIQDICANGGGAPTGVPIVGQLQTLTLNIVGVGTHWLQGGTSLSFGSGVVVDALTINSPTTATAQITVLSSAPIGFATASAFTDGEDATLQQAIDIESGFPTLLAISPSGGEQGATVTMQILGRFTHWTPGVTQVTFNNSDLSMVPGSLNVIDSQNLTVQVYVSPLAYDDGYPCGHVITVTTPTANEQVSTSPIQDNFCVSQGAEEITSVSSLSGSQGSTQTVSITGSATNFVEGETTVSFGDPNFQVGVATVNGPTSLTVPVSVSTAATPGFKTVTVTT